MYTVYQVENTTNNDLYVGVTQFSPDKRWRRHQYNARIGLDTYFYRAIRKYGVGSFVVSAVASVLHPQNAGAVERDVILSLRPTYNQTNGGEVTVGRRVSTATTAKIAAKNRGIVRTAEQRRAMSICKKAQFAADPALKESHTKTLLAAKLLVDEGKRRAAVSRAAADRVWTPESREKLAAAHRGRKHAAEVVKRIALAHNRPVVCPTLNAAFDSVSEAAAATGLSISGVSSVCTGRRNSANGMVFSFA